MFYALSDYIGEDNKLNLALHDFLMYIDTPMPAMRCRGLILTSRGCWRTLWRAQTPENLQYFIDDSFEKITLYDNKAIESDFAEGCPMCSYAR